MDIYSYLFYFHYCWSIFSRYSEAFFQFNLVLRDIDLFQKLSNCDVGLTITSTDEDVVNNFEPHGSSFEKRIKVLEKLHNDGIDAYAFIGPILPGLTDLGAIFKAIQGKVNFVMAESLNMKCGNRRFIEGVVSTRYPHLLPIYGKVICLNENTGELVWTYQTDGWVLSTPAVVDDKLYVGSFFDSA